MTTIDQIISSWFNSGFGGAAPLWVGNLCLILLSIVLAIAFSGVIGFEREYNGHAAGLRTHILVATGSAIVMMISIYGFAAWDAAHPDAVRDPARLAAQIVTGIGFLGAGTILAFVALVMMRKIEETIAKRNPILVLLFPSDKAVLADLLSIAANHNIKIMATESFLVEHEGEKAIQITIRMKHTPDNSVSLFVDDIRVSLKPLDLKYTINN